jgi:HEAT repeat protein
LSPACVTALAAIALASGCQVWPFRDNERTSIITPAMRAATIREIGTRADDATEAEQLAMCEELAAQIRTEPDPIVRRVIQESIAEFQTPLATQVLLAGLNDDDRDVRLACCQQLGKRQDPEAVGALSRVVGVDAEMDVRMAAIEALGRFESPDAVRGLAPAIKDRDPALQYAGVQAMKKASGDAGEDLGNDVEAWRRYADSLPPIDGEAAISVARETDSQPPIR